MHAECEKMRERMDLLHEGELGQREKEQLDRHLEVCESCRILLAEERSLIQGLRNLKTWPCPDPVVKSVLRMIQPARKTGFSRIPGMLARFPARKPAYAFAAVLAAALIFYWLLPGGGLRDTVPVAIVEKVYDTQEIEKSRAQAEWSLMYVSKKLNQAQEQAVKDVVIRDLPKTLQNTIKKTVPFFKGGRI